MLPSEWASLLASLTDQGFVILAADRKTETISLRPCSVRSLKEHEE